MNRKHVYLLIALFITVMFASCTYSSNDNQLSSPPNAWIDAPINGSEIPVVPYEIISHASSSAGISEIELSINFEVVHTMDVIDSEATLITMPYIWDPPNTGTFTIQVRSKDNSGNYSEHAEAIVIVLEKEISSGTDIVPSPTMTPTQAPTDLPIATIAPTECVPELILQTNANCRTGPHPGFDSLTLRIQDEIFPVIGHDSNWLWWLVQLPQSSDQCWISESIVETSCNAQDIELVSSPPLILEVSSSTSVFYWGDCDLRNISINAEIFDDAGISEVIIRYRLEKKSNAATSSWLETEMEYQGGNLWSAIINSHSLPGYTDLSEAWLEYNITVTNNSGLTDQTGSIKSITLKKCE